MQEIRIGKKSWIIPIGILAAIGAIVIGVFFFSIAGTGTRKAVWLIYLISVFLVGVGIFALFVAINQYRNPSFLLINDYGVDNQTSFGQILWDEIEEVSFFEGAMGTGKSRTHISGVLIQLFEPETIIARVTGAKRFGVNFSQKNWGSPAVIYGSNWSMNMIEIEENIQRYLTAHRLKSKRKQ